MWPLTQCIGRRRRGECIGAGGRSWIGKRVGTSGRAWTGIPSLEIYQSRGGDGRVDPSLDTAKGRGRDRWINAGCGVGGGGRTGGGMDQTGSSINAYKGRGGAGTKGSLDTEPACVDSRNAGCKDRESSGGAGNGTVDGAEGSGGRTGKAVVAAVERTTPGKGVDLEEPQAEGWIGQTPIMALRNKSPMSGAVAYPRELQTRGPDGQEPKKGQQSWRGKLLHNNQQKGQEL